MTVRPSPQHILIIRPSALGDVCRSVGVLASLRHAFPNAIIDWLVQSDFVDAIRAHPALNEAICFPRKRFSSWWRSPATSVSLLKWVSDIRRRKYDWVIDCQGLARSGSMTWFSGAATRAGLRWAREFAWLGYNLRVPRSSDKPVPPHTVDQMFLLVEALGVEVVRDLRLHTHEDDRQWWHDVRQELGFNSQPYAILAPTARWQSKRWPIDRFSQLVEPLMYRGFSHVVVIGSPSEREQVQPLFEAMPSPPLVDMVGKSTIGQTMAMIEQAGLVIANDSAPLHMAVGFDRPCVGLFGPTEPSEVGPYHRDDAVVRGYHPSPGEVINYKDPKLGDSLMRFISTVSVIRAMDLQLARAMPSPSDALVENRL